MTRKRPWVNRHPNALLTLYPYSNCFPGGVKRALHIERVTERMFVGCIKCSCEPTEVRLFVGRSKGDGSRTIHLPPVIYCAEHGVEFLRRLRKHEPMTWATSRRWTRRSGCSKRLRMSGPFRRTPQIDTVSNLRHHTLQGEACER